MKKEAAEWTEQEEDILTYAMFPKVAPKFFKDRRDRKYGVDGKHSDAENNYPTVSAVGFFCLWLLKNLYICAIINIHFFGRTPR